MNMWRKLFVVIAACGAGLSLAPAQVNVEKGKVNIEVTPLGGTNGPDATKVLQNDLNRTMMISASSGGSTDQFTVSGSFTGGTLSGKLVSKSSQQEKFNKTYSGEWRQAIHEFADDITLAATGVAGFATSKVAFIASDTGKKELYLMDIDGAHVRKLTADNSISNGPAWSKDGSMIAYTSYKSGYPDVYMINVGSLQRTRVAFFPGINAGPSFSPDGSTLALTLSKDGNPEIYTMPATGGGAPVRLTRTRGGETSPSWSPSGERIVYTSDDRGSVQIFTMAADGSNVERLQTNSGFSSEPDWSPDGKTIVYNAMQGGRFEIAVLDMATGKTATLTRQGGEDPGWTRNSRHVIYSNGGALYLLDTVSKLTVRLNNNLNKCSEPAVSR